ncbi:GH16487 [Drosophila grimshawi]|uniref:GH16487 n=1 Tax=Drosophila grimshawi TaxID=7222 RepID=B4J0J6_DROGR|nr:GH16487 [Drosophila grimshawi]
MTTTVLDSSNELSQFIDSDILVPWGRIACRRYGKRQVRPLLATYGWMNNMGSFACFIPLLYSAHMSVVCIERPGHGRSSHYPALSVRLVV